MELIIKLKKLLPACLMLTIPSYVVSAARSATLAPKRSGSAMLAPTSRLHGRDAAAAASSSSSNKRSRPTTPAAADGGWHTHPFCDSVTLEEIVKDILKKNYAEHLNKPSEDGLWARAARGEKNVKHIIDETPGEEFTILTEDYPAWRVGMDFGIWQTNKASIINQAKIAFNEQEKEAALAREEIRRIKIQEAQKKAADAKRAADFAAAFAIARAENVRRGEAELKRWEEVRAAIEPWKRANPHHPLVTDLVANVAALHRAEHEARHKAATPDATLAQKRKAHIERLKEQIALQEQEIRNHVRIELEQEELDRKLEEARRAEQERMAAGLVDTAPVPVPGEEETVATPPAPAVAADSSVASVRAAQTGAAASSSSSRSSRSHAPSRCPDSHCPAKFKNPQEFHNHIKSSHPSTPQPFPCGIEMCTASFKAKAALASHQRAHREKAPKMKHHCPDPKCPKLLSSEKLIKSHIEKEHPTPPLPRRCPYGCTATFAATDNRTNKALTKHTKLHRDRGDLPLERPH